MKKTNNDASTNDDGNDDDESVDDGTKRYNDGYDDTMIMRINQLMI